MLPRRAHEEGGQAIVIAVFFMTVLLGFCALALDVGHAYLTTRDLQASVDAAALAGAQVLPNVAQANARATEYGPGGLNVPGDAKNVVMAPPVTKCIKSAPGCSPANAIVVQATADVPTVFAGLFGISKFTVHAKATACSPCGQKPLDVMLVLDRTGSMCTDSAGRPDPNCTDMANARDGMKTFLGLMDPSIDHVGLAVLPPPTSVANRCGTPPDSSSYDSPTAPYVIVPMSSDFLVNGALNPNSDLVSTINCVKGAGWTAYANALEAAQAELVAHGRPGVTKVIVFLSDGAANTGPLYYPANSLYLTQPCHQGITSAQTIAGAGTKVFAIGYDLEHDTCQAEKKSTQERTPEQPPITAAQALPQIASSPGNFYNKPTPGDLSAIFSNIAADLLQGSSRLVDDSTS
jgi:hypothetical protein